MTESTRNPVYAHLHGITCAALLEELGQTKVFSLKSDNTVEDAIKMMSENKIISVPVLDKDGKVIGLVDYVDIITHILAAAPTPAELTASHMASLEMFGRAIALLPLGQLLDSSTRAYEFVPVDEHAPLSMAVELFAKGAHRVPVVHAAEGKLLGVVSQSAVARHLAPLIGMGHMKEMGDRLFSSYGMQGSVASVTKETSVLEAVAAMQKAGVSAVAVLESDGSGRLAANFSATDVRGLYRDVFPDLLMPVFDFLTKHSPGATTPVVVEQDATLALVLDSLVSNKLHRVWVLDADFKPVSIASLTDIMQVITNSVVQQ